MTSMINALATANGQAPVNNIDEAIAMAQQNGGGGPEFQETVASYIGRQAGTQLFTEEGHAIMVSVTKSRMNQTVNGKDVLVPCYGFKAELAFEEANGDVKEVLMEVANGTSLWNVLDPIARKVCNLKQFTLSNTDVAQAVAVKMEDIFQNGHEGNQLSMGSTAGQNGNNKGTVRTRLFLEGTIVKASKWKR